MGHVVDENRMTNQFGVRRSVEILLHRPPEFLWKAVSVCFLNTSVCASIIAT